MKVNPINVFNILMKTYNRGNNKKGTPTNVKETKSIRSIVDSINGYVKAGHMEIETHQELIFEDLTDESTLIDHFRCGSSEEMEQEFSPCLKMC